jgi:hypothetical protein
LLYAAAKRRKGKGLMARRLITGYCGKWLRRQQEDALVNQLPATKHNVFPFFS